LAFHHFKLFPRGEPDTTHVDGVNSVKFLNATLCARLVVRGDSGTVYCIIDAAENFHYFGEDFANQRRVGDIALEGLKSRALARR
jgi:hypothetical protein